MARLGIEGVVKRFDRTIVLDGLDAAVDDGETLSLLGRSGSGKSTLLRIVAGLEVPDAGVVRLGSRDVTTVPAHRRGVGFVSQDPSLFPHLDVAGNVGFGLRMAGWERTRATARVGEVLDLVGLSGHAGRDPSTLSGGEAQRVALARALAPQPSVLLLDEPLAALDQVLRERLLFELRALFDALGQTVITVTHDPAEAAALGHRLAVLVDGVIARTGTPVEVLDDPGTAEVAGLVGHRNVVEGQVRSGMLDCALGAFPVEWADGTVSVLVPPDALVADPAGVVEGTVTGVLVRGGTTATVVDVPGAGSLEVSARSAVPLGHAVRLSVVADRIRVLAPPRP